MKQSAKVKEVLLLACLIAIMTLIFTGTALAADAISLQASEPATIYYTTSGAQPVSGDAPITSAPAATASRSTTPTNYYLAQGTKIIPPTQTPANEIILLVPNAGHKGKRYVKPQKLKIYESRYAFEKHVKDKHGKRYQVMDFSASQTDYGLLGHINVVESKNLDILQLGGNCTEDERANRVAVAKEFLLENSEFSDISENIELRERGLFRHDCNSLHFDQYVNEYEVVGSTFRFGFNPHRSFSFSTHLIPITPEMYAAAQADALPPEEIARIVYKDLGINLNGTPPPKLRMRKYLRNTEPYVYWEVDGRNVYEINAITGEILFKAPNVKY